MPIFNSPHDLFLALYSADLFNRLRTVLDGFEKTRRDTPFAESLNFTCSHLGTCTACLAGRVDIHPRPGSFSVTVPRVSGDRWTAALGVIVPEPDAARPAVRDPFALGPLDGVPGWERLTAFVPGTTVGHLSLHSGVSARTDFKSHTDLGHQIAALPITPAAREHCERAWAQGLRFLGALTSGAAEPERAIGGHGPLAGGRPRQDGSPPRPL
ncbi:hypothetical protein ABZW47_31730 [Streptomyces sp. NPDC004549]|uniref:hypothetical protein n=1 Tax=Streptomyces sp. NPDC004549 TaxID=3154283 RepID=UPI0033AB49A6